MQSSQVALIVASYIYIIHTPILLTEELKFIADIDECENSPCGTDVCVNGIGSYICIPPSRPETQASTLITISF